MAVRKCTSQRAAIVFPYVSIGPSNEFWSISISGKFRALQKTRWNTLKYAENSIWLVVSTPLKNISQLGWVFPIYGKINLMFQTTNQVDILSSWKHPSIEIYALLIIFPPQKNMGASNPFWRTTPWYGWSDCIPLHPMRYSIHFHTFP